MSKIDWGSGTAITEQERIADYEKQMLENITEKTRQQYFNGSWANDEHNNVAYHPPREHKSEYEQYNEEIRHLRTRLHELEAERTVRLGDELEDLRLRAEHRSLRHAWEQYQIVRKLVQE